MEVQGLGLSIDPMPIYIIINIFANCFLLPVTSEAPSNFRCVTLHDTCSQIRLTIWLAVGPKIFSFYSPQERSTINNNKQNIAEKIRHQVERFKLFTEQ